MTLSMLKNRFLWEVIVALGLIIGAYQCGSTVVAPTVTHPLPNVTRVDVPAITKDVVEKYIPDPAQQAEIQRQEAIIRQLKLQLSEVTSTVAHNETNGGNNINGGVIVELPKTQMATTTTVTSDDDKPFSFKDFQLNATYNSKGTTFKYDLNQDFIITTAGGRDSKGNRTTTVSLGQRVAGNVVPIKSTTVELETPAPSKWWTSPRIQGGLSVRPDNSKGGFVGAQWLRKGVGPSAEDSRVALLVPGLI
jgi:hypothetical protein